MGIIYDETGRVFKLDTLHTSYMMGIADEEGFLGHIYYGKRISACDVSYLLRIQECPPKTTGTGFPSWMPFPWNIPPTESGISGRRH